MGIVFISILKMPRNNLLIEEGAICSSKNISTLSAYQIRIEPEVVEASEIVYVRGWENS